MVRPNALTSAASVPRPSKMPQLVARRIAEDILSQRLEPGMTLPPERELTKVYGVSRGTLREALRVMESFGVIEIKLGPNGGAVVKAVRPTAMVGSLSIILSLNRASLVEVIEARRLIEPTTARLAAARATQTEIDALKALVDAMDRELENDDSFRAHNQRFHEAVADAGGNAVLGGFAATLSSIFDGHSAGVSYTTARRAGINANHRHLYEAIRDHDPERAAAEAASHLLEFQNYLERRYPQLLTGPVRWLPVGNT